MKLQRPSSRLKFHEQSTLLGSTVFFSATSSSVPISPTPSGIIFIHSTTSGTKIIFITASGSRRRKKNRPIVEIEFLEIDEIFLSIWKFNENWNSSKWLQNVNFATIFFFKSFSGVILFFSSHFFGTRCPFLFRRRLASPSSCDENLLTLVVFWNDVLTPSLPIRSESPVLWMWGEKLSPFLW